MKIVSKKEQKRLERIGILTDSIKKAKDPDYDRLVMMCCAEWGVSKRTAKELIEVAKYNIERKQ